MAKMRGQFVHQRTVARRGWRVDKIAVLVVLAVVVVPFLIEAVAVGVAQWAEVIGTRIVVQTPLLNWCGSRLDDCRQLIGELVSDQSRDISWEPGFVLPILAVFIIIAMLMMRR
jgi:hypothetical protein